MLEGEVEIIKAIDTADERLLGVWGAGEALGEMSLLSEDERRTASVRARTMAQLIEIRCPQIEMLLSRERALAYAIMRALVTRLRQADDATIRDLREKKNRRLVEAHRDLERAHT